VLSDWWRQLFQAYGISNIFVIPNAIPDAVELLKSNKSPRREKIIFSMARLEKNKNIQLVISALAFCQTIISFLLQVMVPTEGSWKG